MLQQHCNTQQRSTGLIRLWPKHANMLGKYQVLKSARVTPCMCPCGVCLADGLTFQLRGVFGDCQAINDGLQWPNIAAVVQAVPLTEAGQHGSEYSVLLAGESGKGHALYGGSGASRAGKVIGMIASGLNGSNGSSTPPGSFSAHGCDASPHERLVHNCAWDAQSACSNAWLLDVCTASVVKVLCLELAYRQGKSTRAAMMHVAGSGFW